MRVLLMYSPSDEHLAALRQAALGAEFVCAQNEQDARHLIRDAEVVMGNRYFLQSLPHARRLCWMQSNSVGADYILTAGSALDGITITCARGVYDAEMAEHALALLLGVTRNLRQADDQQRERNWARYSLQTLAGRRGLILGFGGVGLRLAEILRVMGVQVEGVRRRLEEPGIDAHGFRVWSPDTWRARLPEMDFLVLALPLTKETYHIVGTDEISFLPPQAVIVNVGRGGTLAEEALLAAVREDRLCGAGLDVLESEPPAPDHPIWSEARILLTPHVARSMESPPFRWEPLFVENLRRYAAGEALLNVVDPKLGY